ncbi:unnamed protein product [Echinostoma caproni]|uniref:tRNA-binding domain-containing protein n=1 Tax=Echinostoma caproni TaxID=27848 RepID=A0A183AT28_9TREM|nr:unnamed protein product [Echinostoma caproni]
MEPKNIPQTAKFCMLHEIVSCSELCGFPPRDNAKAKGNDLKVMPGAAVDIHHIEDPGIDDGDELLGQLHFEPDSDTLCIQE